MYLLKSIWKLKISIFSPFIFWLLSLDRLNSLGISARRLLPEFSSAPVVQFYLQNTIFSDSDRVPSIFPKKCFLVTPASPRSNCLLLNNLTIFTSFFSHKHFNQHVMLIKVMLKRTNHCHT